jgi:Protein of unknown function (DUF3455)
MLRLTLLIVAVGLSMALRSPQDDGIQKELERLHVPASLVPKDKQPLFLFRAEGTQTYAAEEKDGKLQWGAASTPDAKLLDYRTGEQVGTHSKGPVWEDKDGSKLTGKKVASEAAPNVSAIPWLLLEVKSEKAGRLAKVTHIQRVDTWGGLAPGAAPTKPGDTQAVRYEATYVLLGDK